MAWTIELSDPATRALKKIDRQSAKRIAIFLRETLANADNPRQWGKPLKGALSEYWSYRVGDYRLISTIADDIVTITIIRIGNRRDVYK